MRAGYELATGNKSQINNQPLLFSKQGLGDNLRPKGLFFIVYGLDDVLRLSGEFPSVKKGVN